MQKGEIMPNLTDLVPRPKPEDINSGLRPLPTKELIKLLGMPGEHPGANCQPITNMKLKRHIITMRLGNFRATGLDFSVNTLIDVFTDIKELKPKIYPVIGSAGMLCFRLVRGSQTTLSNHSFGAPIDLTIGGVLDKRGDDKVQMALLEVYPIFHKHGFYWGAEYPTEDAMHFEPSYELFLEHKKELLKGD
jgi:hypothetical protein